MRKNASPLRLILSLFVICLIVGIALAFTNHITKDAIADVLQSKKEASMQQVLAAESYDPVEYTGSDAFVTEMYSAAGEGYVVRVSPKGFGGAIDMMVGVDSDGNVTGVSIVSMKETAGLGAKASEPDFTNQFVGKAGSVSVNKDGGEIVALTSSTITSRAVCDGVNSALNAVKEVG